MFGCLKKKAKVKSVENVFVLSQLDDCPHMQLAYAELGVSEVYGRKHNPRILQYHNATGYGAKTDEVAWCSSFINWVLAKAGYKTSGRVNARSWLEEGRPLIHDYPFGGVCVLWRGSRKGWKGHVGFIVKSDEKNVWLLGGNQSNRVKISKYPKTRVLGVRWPAHKKSIS